MTLNLRQRWAEPIHTQWVSLCHSTKGRWLASEKCGKRSRLRFGSKSKLRWQRKPNSHGIHQNRKVAGRSRHRAIWVVCTYYARWFDSPRMAFSYLDWCCNYVRYPSDAYDHETLQWPTRSIKNQRLLALRTKRQTGRNKPAASSQPLKHRKVPKW